MRFIKYILPVIIIFSLFSCNNGFNKDELEKIKVGDTKEILVSKVGNPLNTENIERYIYDNNNTVYIYKGKVNDYFFSSFDTDNFKKIKIGITEEELVLLIGKPIRTEDIDIVYYKDYQKIVIYKGAIESIDLHSFQDLSTLDKVRLNFNGNSMLIVNIALAIIMFGVALDIEVSQFKEVLRKPKSLLVGMLSQFIVLPALTFLFILIIEPTASVALGMILVAASPGGNISNFITSLAKGNSALSISLTAFATVSAVFMTPFNFSFWGGLYSSTSDMMIPIDIDPYQMVKTVMILLGIPVVLGILFKHYFSEFAIKISKPLKTFSLVFFIGLVIGAMSINFGFILKYIHLVLLMVFAHNLIALSSGYALARVFKLPKIDRRTLSIETGIQNSGLALVLIFNPNLFDGLGGMAFIAAWWAIWHIVSGLTIASIWKRIPTNN